MFDSYQSFDGPLTKKRNTLIIVISDVIVKGIYLLSEICNSEKLFAVVTVETKSISIEK